MTQPSFDAASSFEATDNSTNPITQSWNHTCGGANRVLFVWTTTTSHNAILTGVTYSSVAMTKGVTTVTDTNGFTYNCWYLKNPASGTHAIAITSAPGDAFGTSCVAMSVQDADQTTTFGTWATFSSGGTTNDQVTVSGATGELVVAGGGHSYGDSSFLPQLTTTATASGVTQRATVNNGYPAGSGGYTEGYCGDMNSGASVTPKWTLSASVTCALIGVSVKPVSAPSNFFPQINARQRGSTQVNRRLGA